MIPDFYTDIVYDNVDSFDCGHQVFNDYIALNA